MGVGASSPALDTVMNVLPVITRELRTQARQSFTYWLRWLGVLAMLVGALLFGLQGIFESNFGSLLFAVLHLMLFGAIWVFVPFSAADCISRERREGTLGLLFLTPLRPADIVVAKGLAHALRAGTLLVAVLPVLTIPFLLGGISWQQVATVALANLSSVCWALAVSLVASALTRKGARATASAAVLAMCSLVVFGFLVGHRVIARLPATFRPQSDEIESYFEVGAAVVGLHPRILWSGSGAGPVSTTIFVLALAEVAAISVLLLILAVVFAANRIRHSWQEEPPSVRVQRIQRVFVQPVMWVGLLRRWMRWKLERNPVGWLEQRRWSGRLVIWTWFAIIISVQSAALADNGFSWNYGDWERTLAWALTLSLAASAAGSFRRERETGVLELLLVSPLRSTEILGGRLRGLWGQFLPAVVALLGVWVYFAVIFPRGRSEIIWFFATTYLVVPVIGLYWSLRCRHFLSAFLLTLAFAIAIPCGVRVLLQVLDFGQAMGWGGSGPPGSWQPSLEPGTIAMQLVLGGVFLWRLRQNLEQRLFPLERGLA